MDGGDRAAYKQISKNVDSRLLSATMGAVSGDWFGFEVISTGAQIAYVTASGFTGSSLITSATTYPRGAWFGCAKFTAIKVSTGTLAGAKKASKLIAYKRILI